ncbi:C4-dicarboxylate ABC transporter [Pseudonocardia sp. C8]|uniref:SLC13 family permease n=1 Tax=Pseudonocardia sp. C8 TaxID=2762759 RepID=UPI0016424054|nr:SLC13 family permease [Pseudonocardia sp. C8]MBC3191779.1 C4-dicarboxylate ABC transporter [Pseudonocardia sp. C8]
MTHAVSVAVLVTVFVLATTTPVSLGVLAFAAAFLVGAVVSGVPPDDVVAHFPGDIFLIVVGVTLLFGIARANGTLDFLVSLLIGTVRGRRWAVLWAMFALGAVLMSLGAVLAVGMLAPIAMPIARRYRIDPLLMGVILAHGALGAAFSPITLYGGFVNGWLSRAGLPTDPLALYLIPLGLSFVIALAVFLIRGRGLLRGADRVDDGDGGDPPVRTAPAGAGDPLQAGAGTARTRVDALQGLTLLGLVGLLVGTAGFGVDVGVGSLCIATVLLLVAPQRHRTATDGIAWPAVLLVCGMLTFMGVLEQNGTLELLGNAAAGLGSPLLTAFVLCCTVAALSAVGSSIGTLGVVLPLAGPLLATGGVSTLAVVAALAFCTIVVDISPFSSNGVLVLASAEVDDRAAFQRQLLRYCVTMVLVAPPLGFVLVALTS